MSLMGQVLPQNYLRFRISPEMTIALGATVLAPGQELGGADRRNVSQPASAP